MGGSPHMNECYKIALIIFFGGKVYYQSGWTGNYGFCQNKTKVAEKRSKMEYVMFPVHRKYILLIIE
jgi:hypothetical protein